MDTRDGTEVRSAEVVLPCSEIDATLRFFTEQLGFRLETIFPADDPVVAVIAGHGTRLRLERGRGGAPGVLRLACRDPALVAGGAAELTAPNGTRIELVEAEPPLHLPPLRPSFVCSRNSDDACWSVGRAGMGYRDLVPDRQGGRFIASHIRIAAGGPVPDSVHLHRVRFQMIYCYRGSVRVVYEDQGPPFWLQPGDCVLQPPAIRHRVLESSPGLEVIEIGCPAEHETHLDHELELPTSWLRPERDFGGQRFVRHVATSAEWRPSRLPGFDSRDLGIAAATHGLASAQVLRRRQVDEPVWCRHNAEFLFRFVLEGTVMLHCEPFAALRLAAGDAFVVPAGSRHAMADASHDLQFLEVALPAIPA